MYFKFSQNKFIYTILCSSAKNNPIDLGTVAFIQ